MADLEESPKKYIGVDKPRVEIVHDPKHWPGKLYPEWELQIEEGDHLREDEQGWS